MFGSHTQKGGFVILLFLMCGSAFVYAQGKADQSASSVSVKIPPPLENGVRPVYQTPQVLPKIPLSILTSHGAEYKFNVEIARTQKEKNIGLMFRNHVPAKTGMLFLFDKEAERSFWMKNTWISLDLLFIRKDGVIGHIHAKAKPRSLKPIPSEGSAYAVLEIGAGEAERLEITVGDRILYEEFQ